MITKAELIQALSDLQAAHAEAVNEGGFILEITERQRGTKGGVRFDAKDGIVICTQVCATIAVDEQAAQELMSVLRNALGEDGYAKFDVAIIPYIDALESEMRTVRDWIVRVAETPNTLN